MAESCIKFHDPLIVREDGTYYCLSTDTDLSGVQIASSSDLITWSLRKSALAAMPGPVKRHTQASGFWAPELVRVKDELRLYCCASQFGTSQSVISLAKSSSILEDFYYEGDILKTYQDDEAERPNAIDPNVLQDKEGNWFLIYGSFFGGIYIIPLDESGYPAEAGYGTRIAGGHHRAVEGAYAFYDESRDLYYLFVSCGSLTYDYNIRVATSRSIRGPYVDSQGQDLCDTDPIHSPGDKMIGSFHFDLPSSEGWIGPGHNSILRLDDGIYLVHHIRRQFDSKMSYLQIRKIFFLPDGRLIASPVTLDSSPLSEGTEIADYYSFIHFDRFNNGVIYGRKLPAPAITSYGEDFITFLYNHHQYIGKILEHNNLKYITAMNDMGECLWGQGFSREEAV